MFKNEDIQEEASSDSEKTLKEVTKKYNGNITGISDIEAIAKQMLSTLPVIDRNKIRKEISEMHVPIYDDPTTFNINEGLALVQGYKDRLASILILAQREFKMREKMFDMLVDANNVISKASSADKRKAEAVMKYAVEYINLEYAETFMEEIERIMNNMKSIGEVISRQASVLAVQVQLGEYVKRKPGMENDSQAEEINYKSGVKNLDWNTF